MPLSTDDECLAETLVGLTVTVSMFALLNFALLKLPEKERFTTVELCVAVNVLSGRAPHRRAAARDRVTSTAPSAR